MKTTEKCEITLKYESISRLFIFSWGTHLYMSLFPSVRPLSPSVCPSICCGPYLRNYTLCYPNFWYIHVNDNISGHYFPSFKNFDFSGHYTGKRVKVAQNEKQKFHPSCIRNNAANDYDFWCTCIKWLYLHTFFQFLKI